MSTTTPPTVHPAPHEKQPEITQVSYAGKSSTPEATPPPGDDDGLSLADRFLWLGLALLASTLGAMLVGLLAAALTGSAEKGLQFGATAFAAIAAVSVAALVFLHGAGPKR